MQFGVFDHMDRGEQGIGQQYRDRLQLIAAYEGAGVHAYHRAEHHGTPLGVARPETSRCRQWPTESSLNSRFYRRQSACGQRVQRRLG